MRNRHSRSLNIFYKSMKHYTILKIPSNTLFTQIAKVQQVLINLLPICVILGLRNYKQERIGYAEKFKNLKPPKITKQYVS